MRFSAYIILIFSISLCLYLVGEQSPFMQMQNCDVVAANGTVTPKNICPTNGDSFDLSNMFKDMINYFMSDVGIQTILGIGGVVAIASLLFGQGINFILPVMFVLLLTNYFLLPVGDIFMFNGTVGSMQWLIHMGLMMFFNIMLILSVTSFVRGDA